MLQEFPGGLRVVSRALQGILWWFQWVSEAFQGRPRGSHERFRRSQGSSRESQRYIRVSQGHFRVVPWHSRGVPGAF